MTMRWLNLIAPNYCKKCGLVGDLLCENCKKHIIYQAQQTRMPIRPKLLQVGYIKNFYYFDYREGVIKQLLNNYKLGHNQSVALVLANLLATVISDEFDVVIPLPTSIHHRRKRGFDHAYYLAKELAAKKDWGLRRALKRLDHQAQVGKNRADRIATAKKSYQARYQLDSSKRYLLVDDILTTGASVRYAARALYQAGARNISVAVVAKQRDK